MQLYEIYIGHIKFQVILSLKNSVLRKNILALISRSISVSLLLILINKDANPSFLAGYLKKKKHRKTIYIRTTFCQSNKHCALKFIGKLEGFTKEKYSFVIIWKTRNIRSLFNLTNKTSHVSSVVYEGKCNCGEDYIGEEEILP